MSDEKVPYFVKFEQVCAAMRGERNKKNFPKPFAHNLMVCLSDDHAGSGKPTRRRVALLIHDDNIVEEINVQGLSDLIVPYCRTTKEDTLKLVDDQAKKCAIHFIQTSELKKRPPIFASKSSDELCFCRLPFDLKPLEQLKAEASENFVDNCPLFYEFVSRCTNKDALCAFIGSIFEPDSDLSQYLWIYGDGRDGKSKLLDMLAHSLGPAYTSEDKNVAKQFGSYYLRNKRLIGFADFDDHSWPSKESLIKRITGEDLIRMEIKQKEVINERVRAKIIFTSNLELQVQDIKADTRRAIYVKVEPFKGEKDCFYLEKLIDESQGIIDHCRLVYHTHCPDHKEIPVDENAQRNVTDEFIDEMEGIIEQHYVLEHGAIGTAADMKNAYKSVRTNVSIQKFYHYLKKAHNIERTKKRVGENKESKWVYEGIKPKPVKVLYMSERQ